MKDRGETMKRHTKKAEHRMHAMVRSLREKYYKLLQIKLLFVYMLNLKVEMRAGTLSIDKDILTAKIRHMGRGKFKILHLKMVEINTSIKQQMHQMYLAARENETMQPNGV